VKRFGLQNFFLRNGIDQQGRKSRSTHFGSKPSRFGRAKAPLVEDWIKAGVGGSLP
jgi:hypothetical protein